MVKVFDQNIDRNYRTQDKGTICSCELGFSKRPIFFSYRKQQKKIFWAPGFSICKDGYLKGRP